MTSIPCGIDTNTGLQAYHAVAIVGYTINGPGDYTYHYMDPALGRTRKMSIIEFNASGAPFLLQLTGIKH